MASSLERPDEHLIEPQQVGAICLTMSSGSTTLKRDFDILSIFGLPARVGEMVSLALGYLLRLVVFAGGSR